MMKRLFDCALAACGLEPMPAKLTETLTRRCRTRTHSQASASSAVALHATVFLPIWKVAIALCAEQRSSAYAWKLAPFDCFGTQCEQNCFA